MKTIHRLMIICCVSVRFESKAETSLWNSAYFHIDRSFNKICTWFRSCMCACMWDLESVSRVLLALRRNYFRWWAASNAFDCLEWTVRPPRVPSKGRITQNGYGDNAEDEIVKNGEMMLDGMWPSGRKTQSRQKGKKKKEKPVWFGLSWCAAQRVA